MFSVAVVTSVTKYSRLSLSRIPRDSEILRDIRTSTYRKIIRTTTFNKFICNWTLEVRDIVKNIVEKRRGAISFHNIFHLLFEISGYSR